MTTKELTSLLRADSAPGSPGVQALRDKVATIERENQELLRANSLLRASEARLGRVLEGSEQGYWDWDLTTQEFYVSERYESMLGYALGERNISPENWPRYVHPDDLPKAAESIRQHLAGLTSCHEVEIRCLTKSGEWKYILTRGKVVQRAADGTPLMMAGTHTDITERNTLLAKLKLQAHEDYLTGLNNRGYFMEQAELELKRASRYGNTLAVLMLDIDNFKAINDSFGHATGDLVLKALADIFRKTLRDVDIVGRVGGEEFAVLLPEIDKAEAFVVAERLRSMVEHAAIAVEHRTPLRFTVSIGVSVPTSEVTHLHTLLSQADEALYRAKNAGRNQVRD